MANHRIVTRKLSILAFAVGFFSVAAIVPVHALPLDRAAWPIYTVVVERTTPPNGWAEFCATYKSECNVERSTPRKIALTSEVWGKLVEVDHWANAHIKPTPDRKHWGRINKWYFAEDGRGDCKDYVLVKRRMLMQAGLPREALLITVVFTPRDKGHAVLLVRTDKGDYVLDNLSSKVVLWNQTPYDYFMRQTQSDPNTWVYIDRDPLKPPNLPDEIAENALHEPTVKVTGLNQSVPKIEMVADGDASGGKSQERILARVSVNATASSANVVDADRAAEQLR